MTKQALRQRYLDQRKKLTRAECAHYSLQLYNYFFASVDLSFIKVLHTYLPIEKNNEPDTWMIIDRVRREFPQIRISLPRIGPDGTLESLYFEGLHQLKKNKWGIPEPAQGVPTLTEKIDLVIVPLLAFDAMGYRVGYGKGYYDRFLDTCRKDCVKTGLSFFEGEDAIEDSNELDVRLNLCITPRRVYTFEA